MAFATESEVREIGDADLNSVINVKDATLIQKYVASLVELSPEALKVSDADASGKVNVKDATLIQKYVAGLVDSFPAESTPEASTTLPTEEPTQDYTESEATLPTEAPTKPPVDDEGYFDVVIRP